MENKTNPVNAASSEPLELIIPDVHGRTFWKDAVMKYPDVPVIFLGDYLDPYNNCIEHISSRFAISNFLEILEYKHTHEDMVTLLLGNHDLHYLSYDLNCSRKDEFLAYQIGEMIKRNFNVFQLATWLQTESRQVLFSHAGILSGWWNLRFPEVAPDSCQTICDTLNDKMGEHSFLVQLVMDCSWLRGGMLKCGSPVWADVDEYLDEDAVSTLPEQIYQVFGHSQQVTNPVFGDRFCCLDCRRAFLLTKSGEIAEIETTL